MSSREPVQWSNLILTAEGIRMRQVAVANHEHLEIDIAKVGSGTPTDDDNIMLMTDLKIPVLDGVVKRSWAEDINHKQIIHFDNKTLQDDIFVTELGVFAKLKSETEWKLFGYAYTKKGYISMSPMTSPLTYELFNVGINMSLSNVPELTLTYDLTTVYVTHWDLLQLIPTERITTIPIAPYNPIWELYEIHDGITAPLENWAWINGSLKSIPFEIKVDYNTKETTIYSTMQYANRQWEIHKAGDNAYRLISGDIALKITWR